MQFDVKTTSGTTVIVIPGDTLEADMTHEFKKDIAPILANQSKVVFDMSGLRFVDSSGCGALLHCLRTIQTNGGDLRLCRVSRQIAALFKVIRLDRMLGIHDTLDAALAAFKD